MRKSLLTSWVKNVYSLGIETGKTGVLLYTRKTYDRFIIQLSVNNSPVFHIFIPSLYTTLSTFKKLFIPPLNTYLYPLSTEPIIIRTKEN